MASGITTNIAKKIFLKSLAWAPGGLPGGCLSRGHVLLRPVTRNPLQAVIAVHDERFFLRALLAGDVGIGEAYMDGDWSTPDLVAVVRLAVRNLDQLDGSNRLLTSFRRLADFLEHRRRGNTQAGSRRNIAYHYDLGNDFYRLFLDRSLAYSCAYYESADDTLEQAQIRKFDRICRKLRLGPQDHVLEIGTGWGGFAAYAAETYGCRVTTTTISRQQHDYAREVFSRSRAGERIQLLFEDYRNLRGQFDKIVSIEMFEAVGYEHYDDYFGACDRLLKPDGSMLLQTITIQETKVSPVPQAERLDQEAHLSRSRTGFGHRDPAIAGQNHPHAAFSHGRHREALCSDPSRMAPPISRPSLRCAPTRIRRSLRAHVGLLPGVLRGSIPRTLHQRRATRARQSDE